MKMFVSRSSDLSLEDNELQCDEAVLIGKRWAVEIQSLEQLLAFVDKYGRVIVLKDNDNVYLEIYDEYRE